MHPHLTGRKTSRSALKEEGRAATDVRAMSYIYETSPCFENGRCNAHALDDRGRALIDATNDHASSVAMVRKCLVLDINISAPQNSCTLSCIELHLAASVPGAPVVSMRNCKWVLR
jgi:hypothetical protein